MATISTIFIQLVEAHNMMKSITEHLHDERILKAVIHIQQNLDGNLSIKNLSDVANYSPHHFQRLFNKFMGMPIHSYIAKLQLEKTAAKLIYTKTPIAIIAHASGYLTHEAFSRAFKQHYQLSPSKFRKKYAKESSLAHVPGIIACRDLQSRFIDGTDSVAHIFGFENIDSLIGHTFADVHSDISQAPEIPEQFDQIVFKTEKPLTVLCILNQVNHKPIYYISIRHPLYDRNGVLYGLSQHSIELDADLIDQLMHVLTSHPDHNHQDITYKSYIISNGYEQLTQTQIESESLFYLIKNKTCYEIARTLNCSTHDIDHCINQIKQRAHVSSIDELKQYAITQDLHMRIPQSMLKYKTVEALRA